MRFIEPKGGTVRRKKWFALLPVRINRETRWLETVTVEQQSCEYRSRGVFWINMKFIDEDAK